MAFHLTFLRHDGLTAVLVGSVICNKIHAQYNTDTKTWNYEFFDRNGHICGTLYDSGKLQFRNDMLDVGWVAYGIYID